MIQLQDYVHEDLREVLEGMNESLIVLVDNVWGQKGSAQLGSILGESKMLVETLLEQNQTHNAGIEEALQTGVSIKALEKDAKDTNEMCVLMMDDISDSVENMDAMHSSFKGFLSKQKANVARLQDNSEEVKRHVQHSVEKARTDTYVVGQRAELGNQNSPNVLEVGKVAEVVTNEAGQLAVANIMSVPPKTWLVSPERIVLQVAINGALLDHKAQEEFLDGLHKEWGEAMLLAEGSMKKSILQKIVDKEPSFRLRLEKLNLEGEVRELSEALERNKTAANDKITQIQGETEAERQKARQAGEEAAEAKRRESAAGMVVKQLEAEADARKQGMQELEDQLRTAKLSGMGGGGGGNGNTVEQDLLKLAGVDSRSGLAKLRKDRDSLTEQLEQMKKVMNKAVADKNMMQSLLAKDAGAEALFKVKSELAEAHQKIEDLEIALGAAQKHSDRKNRNSNVENNHRIEMLQQSNEELKVDTMQLQSQLAEAQKATSKAKQLITAAQQERDQFKSRLAGVEHEKLLAEGKVRTANAKADAAESQLDHVLRDGDAGTVKVLEQLRARIAELQAELDQTQSAGVAGVQEASAMQLELEQLQGVRDELDEANNALKDAQNELVTLKRDLSKAQDDYLHAAQKVNMLEANMDKDEAERLREMDAERLREINQLKENIQRWKDKAERRLQAQQAAEREKETMEGQLDELLEEVASLKAHTGEMEATYKKKLQSASGEAEEKAEAAQLKATEERGKAMALQKQLREETAKLDQALFKLKEVEEAAARLEGQISQGAALLDSLEGSDNDTIQALYAELKSAKRNIADAISARNEAVEATRAAEAETKKVRLDSEDLQLLYQEATSLNDVQDQKVKFLSDEKKTMEEELDRALSEHAMLERDLTSSKKRCVNLEKLASEERIAGLIEEAKLTWEGQFSLEREESNKQWEQLQVVVQTGKQQRAKIAALEQQLDEEIEAREQASTESQGHLNTLGEKLRAEEAAKAGLAENIEQLEKELSAMAEALEASASHKGGSSSAISGALKNNMKAQAQRYEDQLEKMNEAWSTHLDNKDATIAELEQKLAALQEGEGGRGAVASEQTGVSQEQLAEWEAKTAQLEGKLEALTREKQELQAQLRMSVDDLVSSLLKQVEDLEKNMHDQEAEFHKQLLGAATDLERTKRQLRERATFDAVSAKSSIMEEQAEAHSAEMARLQQYAKQQQQLYKDMKQNFHINEQKNFAEIGVLQAAIRAKTKLAQDALGRMDEAVRELEDVHMILLQNSSGEQERQFVNKIKRLGYQVTERDAKLSKLQSALQQAETMILRQMKSEVDLSELNHLRVEHGALSDQHTELQEEHQRLQVALKQAEEQRAQALSVLDTIQEEVRTAISSRDKAQRDVHFMLVERQEKVSNSELVRMQAQIAKKDDMVRREQAKGEALRDRLQDAERLNQLAMDSDKQGMIAQVRETQAQKVQLQEKVHHLEEAVVGQKRDAARQVRVKHVEVLLHQAELQRMAMMSQWGATPGIHSPLGPAVVAPGVVPSAEQLARQMLEHVVAVHKGSTPGSHKGGTPGSHTKDNAPQSRLQTSPGRGHSPPWGMSPPAICQHCGAIPALPGAPRGSVRISGSAYKRRARVRAAHALMDQVSPAAQKARIMGSATLPRATQMQEAMAAREHRGDVLRRAQATHPASGLVAPLKGPEVHAGSVRYVPNKDTQQVEGLIALATGQGAQDRTENFGATGALETVIEDQELEAGQEQLAVASPTPSEWGQSELMPHVGRSTRGSIVMLQGATSEPAPLALAEADPTEENQLEEAASVQQGAAEEEEGGAEVSEEHGDPAALNVESEENSEESISRDPDVDVDKEQEGGRHDQAGTED